MSLAKEWQSDLNFSDRLTVISKITTALEASVTRPNPADARIQARNTEKEIYDEVLSRDDYDAACGKVVRELIQNEAAPSEDDNEVGDDEVLSPSAISIGKYTNATHHRDGLFSFVYKARMDDSFDNYGEGSDITTRVVALKVTTPSMMEEPHDSEREARILKAIQHDHIIPLLDLFQLSGGRLILVFPFMPYTLEEVLQADRLNEKQAQKHLADMFTALEYLHAAGLIHRDVKPSNILLKSLRGPAYLADFGIAWSPTDISSEDEREKITDVGTTSYRPPELLFGNTHYGCTLDLWAAGCVVAEVASLSKKPLFDAGDLGSELALIQSIFKSLGTPTMTDWPEVAGFRDWGKMQFYEYPAKPWANLLPQASGAARDLVARLVRYESTTRLPAAEALKHAYFDQ